MVPVAEHEHEHDHDEEETIVLTDEEGHEHEFTIIQVIKVEEKDYAILLPTEEAESDEEEGQAIILRIDQDEAGDDILVEIEDEEEFERVAEAWEEVLDEEEWEEQSDDK